MRIFARSHAEQSGRRKRRGIICAASTRAEINDEEREIYEGDRVEGREGRDEAELRTRRRNDRGSNNEDSAR